MMNVKFRWMEQHMKNINVLEVNYFENNIQIHHVMVLIKKSGWQSVGEHENPCCLFQCSPETVKSIGICIPNGVQPLSPYDPNESEMVDAFSFKYCNLDGSGGTRDYIYGCGAKGLVVASSIKYQDACCPQPSCDAADFGKCIYNEETGRSEKYYCGSDGELILSTWQGTE
eukprot:1082806_1